MRILVDDLRSFLDPAPAHVARTSAAAVTLLTALRPQHIDELWLDHDLGDTDTVWPVVELLERAAFEGTPFDIGTIHVHSANPPGVARILQSLRRWGYNARPATNSPAVGHLPT